MNHQPSEERLREEWDKYWNEAVDFSNNKVPSPVSEEVKDFIVARHLNLIEMQNRKWIADWWLDKMKEERKKVVEGIEKLRRNVVIMYGQPFQENIEYNKVLDDILNYIEGLDK